MFLLKDQERDSIQINTRGLSLVMSRTIKVRYGLFAAFMSALTLAIFLPNMQSAYAQTTTSQLTVNSQLSNGTMISGYFVEVIPTAPLASIDSFTPATFVLENDEMYLVGVADYLTFVFDYWLDNESDERWRSISINTDTQLYAVYRDTALDVTETNEAGATGNGISRLQMNNMAAKISIFAGPDAIPVPALNLSGHKLQTGSQVMEYDSMYDLISSGIGLTDTLEAVHMAGIEWEGLTEAQQCYLHIVLSADIQLDEIGLPL